MLLFIDNKHAMGPQKNVEKFFKCIFLSDRSYSGKAASNMIALYDIRKMTKLQRQPIISDCQKFGGGEERNKYIGLTVLQMQ